MFDARIRTVSPYLVTLELRTLPRSRVDNHAPCGIYCQGEFIRLLWAMAEEDDQHLDYVFVGVLVIIEKHDVVRWKPNGALADSELNGLARLCRFACKVRVPVRFLGTIHPRLP